MPLFKALVPQQNDRPQTVDTNRYPPGVAADAQRREAWTMLRKIILSFIALLSAEAFAETLEIEKRSQTINGVTSHYVLEVEIEDIMTTPKLDPASDGLPLTMNQAISLALDRYRETYQSIPRGIASVSLRQFPGWDYRDRWHFRVDIVGDPQISAIVLFSEKVIFPKEL